MHFPMSHVMRRETSKGVFDEHPTYFAIFISVIFWSSKSDS